MDTTGLPEEVVDCLRALEGAGIVLPELTEADAAALESEEGQNNMIEHALSVLEASERAVVAAAAAAFSSGAPPPDASAATTAPGASPSATPAGAAAASPSSRMSDLAAI